MPDKQQTHWTELSIVCPHCGNRGEEGGPWEENGHTPFRLLEEVTRSWPLTAAEDLGGVLLLSADAGNDEVDSANGGNLRFECGQCFGEFPVPENAKVAFD